MVVFGLCGKEALAIINSTLYNVCSANLTEICLVLLYMVYELLIWYNNQTASTVIVYTHINM